MNSIVWLLLFSTALGAQAPSAEELLKSAERIRTPDVAYEVKVGLVDVRPGKRETRSYQVRIRDKDKALASFLTPEIDRGGKVLMVKNDMWVYLPTTAKPLRISPRQKLTGNAAYGDVVRLNFVGNYAARLKREDKVGSRRAYVLDLTAIEGQPVTYDRVEYWVDAATRSPLKALYQTSEGKTLRECYFEQFKKVLGVLRPTSFRLVDHLENKHVTTLVFSGERRADLPELLFEKENFARE